MNQNKIHRDKIAQVSIKLYRLLNKQNTFKIRSDTSFTHISDFFGLQISFCLVNDPVSRNLKFFQMNFYRDKNGLIQTYLLTGDLDVFSPVFPLYKLPNKFLPDKCFLPVNSFNPYIVLLKSSLSGQIKK